jgi:hypothetical protein
LFFFRADGADIPGIPCRLQGLMPTRENKMKRFLKLNAAPAALFALAFAAMIPSAASAEEYCRTDVTAGTRGCGYASLEQCQAMSSGRGGECYRDPFQADTSNALAYQPAAKSAVHHAKRPVANR